MSEDPLDWADRRVGEIADVMGASILELVLRWLAGRFLPRRLFARTLAKQVHMGNELCREAAIAAVDLWAAREAGVDVEELPEVPDLTDEADDFAMWDEELGIDLLAEEVRLAEAIDVVFEGEEEQIGYRMKRLAESEPIRAGKEKMRQRMQARGVSEYVRVVEAGACDACADRVGETRDIDTPFTDHPGCRCSLRPKVGQGWGDEVKERAFQLRKVSRDGTRFSSGIVFGNTNREGKKDD